jgi:arginase family enzyme
MSRLRARCPDCRTLTAVALQAGEYECHSCGRSFPAGLVRVPRAWGSDGECMAEAAFLPLPYPEAAVVDEESLGEQSLALAAAIPERPLVLGGCCCAHVGVVEGLATRHERLAVVWFDAHGDLNTPDSSPSGNLWGMPLRMLVDGDIVAPEDVALVGARNLDPPEEEFIAQSGLGMGTEAAGRALDGTNGVYFAIDFDAFAEDEVASWMPEPGGISLAEAEKVLHGAREQTPVLGAGFTGLIRDERNVPAVARLAMAAGF